MFECEGTKISISRGDTGKLLLTTDTELSATDKAIFTVKHYNGSRVLRKEATVIDKKTLVINFVSEDTKKLQEGMYKWDIRFIISGKEIVTPLAPCEFEILEVVGNV